MSTDSIIDPELGEIPLEDDTTTDQQRSDIDDRVEEIATDKPQGL